MLVYPKYGVVFEFSPLSYSASRIEIELKLPADDKHWSVVLNINDGYDGRTELTDMPGVDTDGWITVRAKKRNRKISCANGNEKRVVRDRNGTNVEVS